MPAHIIVFFLIETSKSTDSIVLKVLGGLCGTLFWLGIGFKVEAKFSCMPRLASTLINNLETYSMATYLVHLPVIYLILGITKAGLFDSPFVVVFGLFAISLLASTILYKILRKARMEYLLGG